MAITVHLNRHLTDTCRVVECEDLQEAIRVIMDTPMLPSEDGHGVHTLSIDGVIQFRRREHQITCDLCDVRKICQYAYDEYNTDGACLADI